jgi:CDP-diacylglycerol--glycerol-3-phosphate 3-phosphatidyltransferase
MVAGPKGKVIAAGKSGKVKTASTMVGLCVWMAFPGIAIIGSIVMWMIVITTVYSGVEYFIQNWNVLWD